MRLSRRRSVALVGGIVTALAVPALALAPTSSAHGDYMTSAELQKEVKLGNLVDHLKAFQRIADRNDDRRTSGTPGYDASARYVYSKLKRAGYNVQLQEFDFAYFEEVTEELSEVSPTARDFEVDMMTYSPSTPAGGITAAIAVVPVDADTGCTAADFAGQSYTGAIAVIRRGGCTFAVKSANAAAAGAIATIIVNNDTSAPDLTVDGTLGTPDATPIPTGGVSLNAGEALAADATAGPVTVRLELVGIQGTRTTSNVIADTRGGNPDNVVMLGAHLDSVPEGPGINDNGTGSAALLEIALQLAGSKVNNKVRFAWWGAEEFNLLGSAHYVENLTPEQLAQISLYLNFDMIGSPNFGRFVYDGDDSDAVGAPAGPPGSAQLEQLFTDYFAGRALYSQGTDFTGRSDYGPFIAVGVPAGGLFTGAEGIKTEEQVRLFGGTAGIAYDPCYHQACDTIDNVNRRAFDQNADAIAHAVAVLSFDNSSVTNARAAAAAAAAARAAGAASAGKHDHEVAA